MSLKFDTIHNIHLLPFEEDNYELALKNYVLFTKIDGDTTIALLDKYISISFDYLAKFEYDYKIVFLNDISFEKLYNSFLELKADKSLVEIDHQQEIISDDVDNIDLASFLKTSKDILTSEESAPIIKFVNSLFYQAIKKKASDIHIDTHEFKGEVKYRIDGILTKHIELDINIIKLIISRIKVVSNLDINEKRVPQDGRTQITISSKRLDIRVSILPTLYGERVVMRILMESEDIPSLDNLGFDSSIIANFEKILTKTHGMILVTGPTGSGKSTTLHALLHKIYTPKKNIITIEDPVEYKSDKINQIQTNDKVGLTFANGLRTILRQDPDVIMVGEIRDTETAKIAIQAALTGHLVFSTLHTNNAPLAISRLIDMGVENFLISSSILGVLAQRLVRVLCKGCKTIDKDEATKAKFAISDTIYCANGCKECNYTGYSGRMSVGEFFFIDDRVKEAIVNSNDDKILYKIAIDNGMIPISTQLRIMLKNGETSLEEAIRVGLDI